MWIWDFHPKESKTLRGIDFPTLTLNRVIIWLKRKEQLNDMNFVKCRNKKKTRLRLPRERGRAAALWVEQLELEVIVRSQCIHRAIRKNNVQYVGQYPSALFLHSVNFLNLGNIKWSRKWVWTWLDLGARESSVEAMCMHRYAFTWIHRFLEGWNEQITQGFIF